MQKNNTLNQRIRLGILLVSLSALVYALHWVIFRDAHHIFIYLVGDIAFVFIEVLMVTLIIHAALSEREKRSMLKKMNMVIGAFFAQVGTRLLKYFSAFDTDADSISKHLIVNNEWTDAHFDKVSKILKNREFKIDCRRGDLPGLQQFIVAERGFLLGLLQNQNLLEREEFTELLWAVTHLAEELSHRQGLGELPDSDYKHLAGDITRAYKLLVRQWLDYMEHLKCNYPYLFSLAMRTNPFDPQARVEVA